MTEQEAIKNINTYIYSELESIPKQLLESLKLACFTLKEVEQYREIGTPEECMAAVEKQTAKKIKQQKWIYTRCSCGHEFSKHYGDGYYSIPQEQKTKYCPDCGQKLDWSDEE